MGLAAKIRFSIRLLAGVASLAGLLLLIIEGPGIKPLAAVTLLAGFIMAAWSDGQPAWQLNAVLSRMIPFGWGLLLPVMREFYWDGIDWQRRIGWLVAALAIIYWLRYARQARLLSRGLTLFGELSLSRRLLGVFLLTLASFWASIMVFEAQGVNLSGDEPHYLLIAQSLVHDGDLNVANQYFGRQYRDYLNIEHLDIHGHQGKNGLQEIYSMHLPGVAVSFAPLIWLIPRGGAIVPVIRLLLAVIAALLFMVIYLCLWRLTGERRFPLLITLIMAWSAPLFFHSIHIYPEIQVSLLVLGALYLRFLSPGRDEPWALVVSGLLLGLLLFWGVKYAIMLYLYGIGIVYSFLRQKQWLKVLLFSAGPVLMQGLFLWYLYHAYGNFTPASIYFNSLQKSQFLSVLFDDITFKMRLEAFLDYFLDQRDGLLLYAPVYLFALAGFFILIRRIRRDWKLLWIILPPLMYIASYAAQTHRGGYCPQGRPLAPVVWALMLLILYWYRHSRNRWMKRRLLPGLVAYGFFITLFQMFNPFTLYQSTTSDVSYRSGLLFQRLSNGLCDLSDYLPSFIKRDGNFAWLPNIVFILLLVLLTAWALIPKKSTAVGCCTGLWIIPWVFIFILFPRIPLYNPVLVDRADVLPHRLFGASLYPRRAENRYFRLGEAEKFPILLSPLLTTETLSVRFLNLGAGSVKVQLWQFDQSIQTSELLPQQERVINIPQMAVKTWQGIKLIQLYVDSQGQNSDLEVEVLPQGRRPRSL